MKKLVPFLMLVLAALSLAAVHLWQELREVRSQTGELKTRITEMQSARLAAATAPTPLAADPVQQTVAVKAPSGVTPTLPAAAPGAIAPAQKSSSTVQQDLVQQMLGTPEGREMMMAQLRMILPQQYPDLGRELGLTPAETEKFLDMLAKHQLGVAADALEANGDSRPGDAAAAQERQRRSQEIQRTNQAEVTAMLGDKMSKWQEYQRTLPLRQQVNQLKASLGNGNDALTDTQSKPLMAALAAEQSRIQEDRRNAPRPSPQPAQSNPQAAMEQQFERAAEDNRRMVSVASSYLNPQQLDSYRKLLEQQQNLQRTLMRSMSSQNATQGTATRQPAAN